MNKSISIFCILAKTGAGKHKFINDILDDKKFIKKTNLKRLIYTTTRVQREDDLIYDDKFNYITIKDFKALDTNSLIEYRSYYTMDQGTVYYCTKTEDFEVNNNLICLASPYQYEYYKIYCKNENIISQYDKFKLYAIIIDSNLYSRLKSIINRGYDDKKEDAIQEIELYDLCRRIISEKNEFDEVFKRTPELHHPMINKDVCYIDNNIYNDNYYKSNLKDIKKFIQFHCK